MDIQKIIEAEQNGAIDEKMLCKLMGNIAYGKTMQE